MNFLVLTLNTLQKMVIDYYSI